MRNTLLSLLVGLASAAATAAPASAPAQSAASELGPEFAAGRVVFANHMASVVHYVEHRKQLRALFAAQNWKGLAQILIANSYGNDLSWYYLGRSAEGLGYPEAAAAYYRNARSAKTRCKGHFIGNDCDGHTFPADIDARLGALQVPVASLPRVGEVASQAAAPR